MLRGGKRDGAGRPAGSLNRRSAELRDRLAEEVGEDFDPVLVLARFAADENEDPVFRADCAAKIAPFVHAKLKHVESEGRHTFDVEGLAERVRRARERVEQDGDIPVTASAAADGLVVTAGIPGSGLADLAAAQQIDAPAARTPTAEPQAPPAVPQGRPKWRQPISRNPAPGAVHTEYDPHE